MGSVPERGRSLTPELRGRRESFDVGIDVDAHKPSPSADVHDDAIEHSVADVPPVTSVADRLNLSTDHGTVSAVESSHSPHDNAHLKESIHGPDTGRKKKKKKKRHCTVDKDSSNDVVHKEHSKHRHKDRSHGSSEKDEMHKKEDGSNVSNKHNIDDVPTLQHSDYETKQKQSVDGAKHREITGERTNSESIKDKRTKSDDSSAFKLSDDQSRTKASDRGTKIVRQYRHQDGIRERTCDKTTASHKKPKRKAVSVFSQFCGI